MNPILSTLEDAAGGSSSIRAAMLSVVYITLIPWAYVSITTQQIQPIPDSLLWLNGIVMGAKVCQRPMEKTTNEQNPK